MLGGRAEGVTCELPRSLEPGAKERGCKSHQAEDRIHQKIQGREAAGNGKVGKMGRKVRLGKVEVCGHRKSSQVKD